MRKAVLVAQYSREVISFSTGQMSQCGIWQSRFAHRWRGNSGTLAMLAAFDARQQLAAVQPE
jgi:hypothetical protein